MAGTLAAQLISLAVVPFLSRFYSPADFGAFGAWAALLGLIAASACLRYELAIVAAETDPEARALLALCFRVALAMSAIVLLIVLLWHQFAATGGGISPALLLLLPVGTLIIGCQTALLYWCNRKTRFGAMTRGRTTTAATGALAQLVGGAIAPSPEIMASAYLAGVTTGAASLARTVRATTASPTIPRDGLRSVAVRNREYPLKVAPSQLINALSLAMPILIVGTAGGASYAGYYAMGQRLFGIPAVLLGMSLGDVYRQRASSYFAATGGFRSIFVRTLRVASLFGLFVALGGVLLSPVLIPWILGSQWVEAVPMLQAMSIQAGAAIALTPTDMGFLLLRRFNYSLAWNTTRALGYAAIWFAVAQGWVTVMTCVWLIVLVTVLLYVLDASLMYHWTPRESAGHA